MLPSLLPASPQPQVWSVVRGKGKVIPGGGTLVIGREQDCEGGCFDSERGAAGDTQDGWNLEYGAQVCRRPCSCCWALLAEQPTAQHAFGDWQRAAAKNRASEAASVLQLYCWLCSTRCMPLIASRSRLSLCGTPFASVY